tara:strand:- start:1889 stop:2725 length:837 start_codon:yes stop_codon:yes gene_type:complete
MSNIKLLGTGCPSPSYLRFGPSTLVEIQSRSYLFDAGSGVTQRLNELEIKSSEIDVLFITHMHSDHIVDIYQLYISGWHQGRNKPFKIVGPAGIRDFFEFQLKAFKKELEGRKNWEVRPNKKGLLYEICEVDKDYIYEDKIAQISPFEVDHKPVEPAYGYKLEFNEGGNNKKIIISGDTRKSKNLIENSFKANALVHEVFLGLDFDEKRMTQQTVRNISDYHTLPKEVGEVAQEALVEKLILTHFVPPVFDEEELKAEIEKTYKGDIVIGKDLLDIEI